MFIFPVGSAQDEFPYKINNSLRFDGSNDYLSRTLGAATSSKKWTWSSWVKISKLGGTNTLFSIDESTRFQNYSYIAIDTNGRIVVVDWGVGAARWQYDSTMVVRDPSSWFHLMVVYDSDQATASDRVKIYFNGTRVTSFVTAINPTLGMTTRLNSSTGSHRIGALYYDLAFRSYLDGYLAEYHFLDGQALDPSLFGETSPTTGQWRPKWYTSGNYGNNGFFLPFNNPSSTATLGYDNSGNGDHWTLTNMVRDGSASDCWSYDSPTSNFATLNPIDKGTNATISNGGLDFTVATAAVTGGVRGTVAMEGKIYFEGTWIASATGYIGIGIATSAATLADATLAGAYEYGSSTGNKALNGVSSAYGAAWAINDIIGVAYDTSTGNLEFFKNGTSQGVIATGLSGTTVFPYVCDGSSLVQTMYVNFGQRPVSSGQYYTEAKGYFRYAPPSGYKALCTANLPATYTDVIESGSFTGNANANGPFVWCNGTPETLTIDGNGVTWGTHADKLANGFKVRTAAAGYNDVATNNWTATVLSPESKSAFKNQRAKGNP